MMTDSLQHHRPGAWPVSSSADVCQSGSFFTSAVLPISFEYRDYGGPESLLLPTDPRTSHVLCLLQPTLTIGSLLISVILEAGPHLIHGNLVSCLFPSLLRLVCFHNNTPLPQITCASQDGSLMGVCSTPAGIAQQWSLVRLSSTGGYLTPAFFDRYLLPTGIISLGAGVDDGTLPARSKCLWANEAHWRTLSSAIWGAPILSTSRAYKFPRDVAASCCCVIGKAAFIVTNTAVAK
ncbi:hypothetical protein K456DRAFT_1700409 [Colletotrichum gloeosporioides 23]|nr:hypothetical protein K456DRAFT_1700409 [Colletotrichum gloeosporioides 23]